MLFRSQFYSIYSLVLSRILAIIPLLINKRLSKSKKIEPKTKANENDIQYIYNDKKRYLYNNIMKSSLKVAVFEFLAESSICIFYFINDKPEVSIIYSLQIFVVINAITQYIVSYIVLNYHFYKHHYLSFAINSFCILILIIIDIIEIVDKKISDFQFYIYIFMRLIKLALLSFCDNYAKHALFTEYISPFTLMTLMAFYETIFLIIFSIPFIFLKTSDTGESIFVDFLSYLKGINILISIGILLCNFFFELFVLIIIDRFSPSHLPLGFLIYSFCINIYKIIKNTIENKENKWFLYTNFLMYIILFIAAMIHNEIIIVNKWGFNKNTKLFLDMKMKDEERTISETILNEDINRDKDNTEDKTEKMIPLKNIPEND